METRDRIRQLVAELIDEQGGGALQDDDAPLLHNNLLDSLDMVKIVVFMEKEFSIDFSDLYFDQDNFNSVDAMVAFVDKHRADRSA